MKGSWLKELSQSVLFRDYTIAELMDLLSQVNYAERFYGKEEVIALEDAPCTQVGIILEGAVEVQKLHGAGSGVTIQCLTPHQIFGEVIIFSQRKTYPATLVANSATVILFISKESILQLCREEERFLENFMALLSNKILMLNQKVKRLAYPSIRQKIADWLLEHYRLSGENTINIPFTKKAWSEQLAIPRPSLSRELGKMQEDGLIHLNGSSITICDQQALERLL